MNLGLEQLEGVNIHTSNRVNITKIALRACCSFVQSLTRACMNHFATPVSDSCCHSCV